MLPSAHSSFSVPTPFRPPSLVCIPTANIPLFLYPFLNSTSKARPFEYLRLTSLGVIGALVKVDDPAVISFLLNTEIIPLCLRTMETGSELSKTVATFIVQKILLDEVGWRGCPWRLWALGPGGSCQFHCSGGSWTYHCLPPPPSREPQGPTHCDPPKPQPPPPDAHRRAWRTSARPRSASSPWAPCCPAWWRAWWRRPRCASSSTSCAATCA